VLLRPQREANGDLARLLMDEIGDGSINSQAREQQGCGGNSILGLSQDVE
jgi:hypothetical protein